MGVLRAAVRLVITVVICFFAALGAFALWASLDDMKRARAAYAEYADASMAYNEALVAYDEEMGDVIAEFMANALQEEQRACVRVTDALLASIETVWKRLNDLERATRRAFSAELRRTESSARLVREYHVSEVLIASHMKKTRLLLEGHRRAHERGEAACIDPGEPLAPGFEEQRL